MMKKRLSTSDLSPKPKRTNAEHNDLVKAIKVEPSLLNEQKPGTSKDFNNNNAKIENNIEKSYYVSGEPAKSLFDANYHTLKSYFPNVPTHVILSTLQNITAITELTNSQCLDLTCDHLLRVNTQSDLENKQRPNIANEEARPQINIKVEAQKKATSQPNLPRPVTYLPVPKIKMEASAKATPQPEASKFDADFFLNFDADFNAIKRVINDCAPDYIHKKLDNLVNDPKRVEKIVLELLKEKNYPKKATSQPNLPGPKIKIEASAKATPQAEALNINADFNKINRVINDCAPDYIHKKLNNLVNDPKRVEKIVWELLEEKTYPKLQDYLEEKNKKEETQKLLNMELDLEDLYKKYPDPHITFSNTKSNVSETYKQLCIIEIKNLCPYLADESIMITLATHNFHLYPTYNQLTYAYKMQEPNLEKRINAHISSLDREFTVDRHLNEIQLGNLKTIRFQKNHKMYKLLNVQRKKIEYPTNLESKFFMELLYIKNQLEIDRYINFQTKYKLNQFQYAKLNNLLKECACCFDDQVLPEDLLACPGDHKFCKTCIQRYAETTIGDSKFRFMCIEGSCKDEFSLETLNNVLDENVFKNMIKNREYEEIRNAKLDNLEHCQFCTYATIIENPNEKIFACLNPQCMREICRFCKEPNHLPLKCEEADKKSIDMRTYIEQKVTEAMIRVCWNCEKRYFKIEGCNLMHCVCGAAMCYVCRQPVAKEVKYMHYQGNKVCQQFSDVAELHKIEMQKALKDANEEFLMKNPNAGNNHLKDFDMQKMINEATAKPAAPAVPAPRA